MAWFASSEADSEAIKRLNHDSDRAVAIVAASLVESRLQQMLVSHMVQDHKCLNSLFNSSGPLGSFSAKIRLAFVMGLTSTQFTQELENMKKIRNEFAHRIHVYSFEEKTIADRCRNFAIVDDVCRDPSDMERAGKYNMRLSIENCANELTHPRKRYLFSAAIFIPAMWNASRRSTQPLDPQPWL